MSKVQKKNEIVNVQFHLIQLFVDKGNYYNYISTNFNK